MSKYRKLWQFIKDCGKERLELTFDEIGRISGVSLDHSFLKYKNELLSYGYKVEKISIKNQTVTFGRLVS